jgi:hypothetical protein
MTAAMDNLFIESPVHRAQLFEALHHATERVQQSRQNGHTALPAVAAPSIAPDAVAPPTEPTGAHCNAVALVAAVGLASVAAQCPVLSEQRKTCARGEHFRV